MTKYLIIFALLITSSCAFKSEEEATPQSLPEVSQKPIEETAESEQGPDLEQGNQDEQAPAEQEGPNANPNPNPSPDPAPVEKVDTDFDGITDEMEREYGLNSKIANFPSVTPLVQKVDVFIDETKLGSLSLNSKAAHPSLYRSLLSSLFDRELKRLSRPFYTRYSQGCYSGFYLDPKDVQAFKDIIRDYGLNSQNITLKINLDIALNSKLKELFSELSSLSFNLKLINLNNHITEQIASALIENSNNNEVIITSAYTKGVQLRFNSLNLDALIKSSQIFQSYLCLSVNDFSYQLKLGDATKELQYKNQISLFERELFEITLNYPESAQSYFIKHDGSLLDKLKILDPKLSFKSSYLHSFMGEVSTLELSHDLKLSEMHHSKKRWMMSLSDYALESTATSGFIHLVYYSGKDLYEEHYKQSLYQADLSDQNTSFKLDLKEHDRLTIQIVPKNAYSFSYRVQKVDSLYSNNPIIHATPTLLKNKLESKNIGDLKLQISLDDQSFSLSELLREYPHKIESDFIEVSLLNLNYFQIEFKTPIKQTQVYYGLCAAISKCSSVFRSNFQSYELKIKKSGRVL